MNTQDFVQGMEPEGHGKSCHHEHQTHAGHNHASKSHAHHGHHGGGSPLVTSAQATIHCLTGCVIGEVIGLAIGVSLGWNVWLTMGLATVLAYISGFTLGLVPVVRRQKISYLEAFKLIWIGEAISIGVMEVVMNGVDYAIGGAQAMSVFAPIFWIGLLFAIPSGFLAAWPVNWWLLKRDLKACH